MPELPEVETVRAGLERWVVGRTFAPVAVLHPRAVRRHTRGAADFVALLTGCRLLAVRRRGKYLWLPLDSSDALIAHLGMSGQLLVAPSSTPPEAHLRVRFAFTDGGPELRFVDQRTFGGLLVATGGGAPDEVPGLLGHIARDPLDPAFDTAAFVAALRRRRTGVKRALLDQTVIGGVGNIYADEALWRARLHYARPTDTLSVAEGRRLLEAVRTVMTAALAEGGTSFDRLYVSVDGGSGYFARSLNVYGRSGQPCKRCGTPIVREKFTNRSSHLCPVCQRKR